MSESGETAGECSAGAAGPAAPEATAAAAAPTDVCAGVFVTCERDHVAKWLADDSDDDERLPAVTLAGFKAYVVEDWLFDAQYPCVVVVATNDPHDTVCFPPPPPFPSPHDTTERDTDTHTHRYACTK